MQACTNDPFYNLGFGEHNKTVSDFGKKVKVCDGGGGPRLPPADEGKPVPRPTDCILTLCLTERPTLSPTHSYALPAHGAKEKEEEKANTFSFTSESWRSFRILTAENYRSPS